MIAQLVKILPTFIFNPTEPHTQPAESVNTTLLYSPF
jgi:hypothetical protein